MFNHVARNSHDDIFYEDDIWPGEDENGCVFKAAVVQRIHIQYPTLFPLFSKLHINSMPDLMIIM